MDRRREWTMRDRIRVNSMDAETGMEKPVCSVDSLRRVLAIGLSDEQSDRIQPIAR